MAINITSIQRGCVYDGPGVRTTIFLKGCSLHCPWCCNPETILSEHQWFIDNSKCLKSKHIYSKLCVGCERLNGDKKIAECPFNVAIPVSRSYQLDELVELILKDKDSYNHEGGVTFSGGEPLLQSVSLIPLLQRLKRDNIHIAFETSLFVSLKNIRDVLPFSDYFLVDLKLQREQGLSEGYRRQIMKNLFDLKQNGKDIVYRLVFVNSVYDDKEMILNRLRNMDIHSIEILKCHNLAEKKYEKLKMRNTDYTPSEKKLRLFSDYLLSNRINNNILLV